MKYFAAIPACAMLSPLFGVRLEPFEKCVSPMNADIPKRLVIMRLYSAEMLMAALKCEPMKVFFGFVLGSKVLVRYPTPMPRLKFIWFF